MKDRLASLIKIIADRETNSGNAINLSKQTGLSKHFFYTLRNGGREIKAGSAEKVLESVNHPLLKDIEKYLAEEQDKAA